MSARSLPILELREPLLSALAKQRRLILTAPTGSGKSTQVPQMLLDGRTIGHWTGGHLAAAAVAARMLAAWVAEERGVKLGEEVGYQIRLDDVTSAQRASVS